MTTTFRPLPLISLLILAISCLIPVFAQSPGTIQPNVVEEKQERSGRSGKQRRGPKAQKSLLKAPRPVTRDFFTGTWKRIGPGQRQAVHLRKNETTGAWELRLLWRTSAGFELDTNWQPRHEYTYEGYAGFLEIVVDQEKSDKDRIVASYQREQHGDRDSLLVESGEVVIYRSSVSGRTLTWLQEPLIQDIHVEEALYPDEQNQRFEDRRIWLFDKESDRHLLWDEIYW